MNMLIPLASLLGIEVDVITDRVKSFVILNAAMIILGFAGATFLVIAGFLALAQVVGGIYAALILGGAFLLLTLAVYLGSRIGESRRRRQVAERRRSTETSAFVTTAAITALPVLLKSPLVRRLGLPAAALAVFLLVRNGGEEENKG